MRIESPRRAAAEVFGVLAIGGALLATPFICAAHWIDNASRPADANVVEIEHANCAEL